MLKSFIAVFLTLILLIPIISSCEDKSKDAPQPQLPYRYYSWNTVGISQLQIRSNGAQISTDLRNKHAFYPGDTVTFTASIKGSVLKPDSQIVGFFVTAIEALNANLYHPASGYFYKATDVVFTDTLIIPNL